MGKSPTITANKKPIYGSKFKCIPKKISRHWAYILSLGEMAIILAFLSYRFWSHFSYADGWNILSLWQIQPGLIFIPFCTYCFICAYLSKMQTWSSTIGCQNPKVGLWIVHNYLLHNGYHSTITRRWSQITLSHIFDIFGCNICHCCCFTPFGRNLPYLWSR